MAATNVGHPAADGEEEKKSYNLDAIRKNHRLVYFSRILVACVAGCGTGIIGYTGLTGFLCYFGAAAFLSLVLWVKLGFNTEPYFTSWLTIWTEALFEGLMVPQALVYVCCGALVLLSLSLAIVFSLSLFHYTHFLHF